MIGGWQIVPSLIFVGKARSLLPEWGSTLVGSSLARRNKTRTEVIESDKHTSLIQLIKLIKAVKSFMSMSQYVLRPRPNVIKLFTAVIYEFS